MRKYDVVFFDVDGTLAAHNHGETTSILERVPQSAVEAINMLKQAEILPVIATGRNKGMIQELMDYLNVSDLIANNGRFVQSGTEVIFNDVFKPETVASINDYLRAEKIPFCFETAEYLYKHIDSDFQPDSSMDIYQLDNSEIPKDVLQFIVRVNDPNQHFQIDLPGVKAVKVAPTVYDITKAESNKAIGVQQFLTAKNIPMYKAAAFGDEENDVEMFAHVKTSIAMGNASEDIKQIADYVTASVNDDGIYQAVAKIVKRN